MVTISKEAFSRRETYPKKFNTTRSRSISSLTIPKIENNLPEKTKSSPKVGAWYQHEQNLTRLKEVERDRGSCSMDTRNWPDWISLSPAGIESIDHRQNEVERVYTRRNLGRCRPIIAILIEMHARQVRKLENESRTILEDAVLLRGGEAVGHFCVYT